MKLAIQQQRVREQLGLASLRQRFEYGNKGAVLSFVVREPVDALNMLFVGVLSQPGITRSLSVRSAARPVEENHNGPKRCRFRNGIIAVTCVRHERLLCSP